MKIDWSKDVTFDAAKSGFGVKAIEVEGGNFRISTPHYGFTVDKCGNPNRKGLGKSFKVRNSNEDN